MRAVLCCVGLVIASAAPVHAQADPDERARTLFEQATAALDAGDHARALALYREAYELAPRAKILLNIGAMLLELERVREAADVFEEYLARPDRDPSRLAAVRDQLQDLDRRLGKLLLDVRGAAGARITIDGAAVGTSPLKESIRITPGRHEVEIRDDARGYRRMVAVDIKGGSTSTLVVDPADDARPHTRGSARRWMVFLRTDLNLEGGAVVAPGVEARLHAPWHAYANALVGSERGAEVGGRVVIGSARVRPVITAGVPVFYVDGLTVVGRVALGARVEPWSWLTLSLDVGVAHAPAPPAGFEATSWLASLAIGIRP